MLSIILFVALVLVFGLPFVFVGLCFAAKRLGDKLAGYYMMQLALVYFCATFAALIISDLQR